MHKIYSRKRLLIPKIKRGEYRNLEKTKEKQRFFDSIAVIFIAMCVVIYLTKAIGPVFEILTKDEAKGLATTIVNREATNIMREHNYEELFTIEKDSNGNITMIKANVFPINEITSGIALKIQESIDNEGRDNIKIPLGAFSGMKIFAGFGPDVKIRISTIGNVETDLKSEFSSQGINQTLHRVYLQVKCHISILTPFSNIEEEVSNQVLIAENVIVGHIPSSYYNLEGMTKSNAADIIE